MILGYGISKERDEARCHACGHEFSIHDAVAVPGPTHAVYLCERPPAWRIQRGERRTLIESPDGSMLIAVGVTSMMSAITIVVFACCSLNAQQEIFGVVQLAVIVWFTLRAGLNRTRITIDAETVTIEELGPMWPRARATHVPTRTIERFFADEPGAEESAHRLTYVTTNGARVRLSRPKLPTSVHDATFAAAQLTELLRAHRPPAEHFVLRW